MTLGEYDASLGIEGFCGVDEAGRGPLAGDVYAAAVILDPSRPIDGLNDSKKLTEKKREALFPIIKEQALAWSIGIATVEEIESYNILGATFLAMRRAVDGLSVKPSMALVDGNRNPGLSSFGQGRRHLRFGRGGVDPSQGRTGSLYAGA